MSWSFVTILDFVSLVWITSGSTSNLDKVVLYNLSINPQITYLFESGKTFHNIVKVEKFSKWLKLICILGFVIRNMLSVSIGKFDNSKFHNFACPLTCQRVSLEFQPEIEPTNIRNWKRIPSSPNLMNQQPPKTYLNFKSPTASFIFLSFWLVFRFLQYPSLFPNIPNRGFLSINLPR